MTFEQMPGAIARMEEQMGRFAEMIQGSLLIEKVDLDAPMSAAEVAKYLGCSVQTVHKKVCEKTIPYSKPPGCSAIFRRRDILKWMDKYSVKVKADTLAERDAALINKRRAV